LSVCECERVQSSSLAQSLHLINSSEIKSKLAVGGGRAVRLATSKDVSDEDKITELYVAAFSREPRPDELATAIAYLNEPLTDAAGKPIAKSTAARGNFQDLIWALMNSKEFLFNH
jgi:hypothetical protein